MAKYYFLNAQQQQMGPVEKTDLVPFGVTRETLVWTEGMPTWTPAGQVMDLADIFVSVPPAPVEHVAPTYPQPGPPYSYQQSNYQQPNMRKPQSYLWLAILSTLFCCLPFGIVSIVYASKVDSAWAQGDYAEAESNSDKAKMWGLIAVGLGFVSSLIIIFSGMLPYLALLE